MIVFIVVFIAVGFVVLHFIDLAVARKYERRNEEMLNNINKLDERKEK